MIRQQHSPVAGRDRSRRRGSILTWFAVFLFAALPLMALVVHLGMVTLTRRQMQTAVNTAAIEGLRFRDELSDADRRVQVQELVSALFDDDLDSSNGDTMQFGAGPDIEFDSNSGIALPSTDFQASRLITNVGVWKPDPRLNTGDEMHGDMVVGDYVYDASDPDHDSHAESSTYSREDFEAQSGGDAFLVRLRRTRPSNGTAPPLDDVPELSSTGPTVPFLFGRGPYGGSEFLNQRERGTIVRATAIARAQRVKAVGSPYMTIPGVSPFCIRRSHWDDLAFGTVWIQSNGDISSDAAGIDVVGQVIRTTTLANAAIAGDAEIQVTDSSGFPVSLPSFMVSIDDELVEVTNVVGTTWTVSPLTESHAMLANVVRRGVVRVADTQSVIPSGDPRGIVVPADSYVPVVEPIAGTDRVIGFGNVKLPTATRLPVDGSDYPFELTLTAESNRIASQNAVAVFLGLESHTSLETILNLHDEYDADPMTVPFTNSLTASSLVRAID